MTKQELAQKIKAKYPQYQSIEDNELADKIIAKYPVYQSQITETKPSLSGLKGNLSQRGEQFKETFEQTASGEINPLQTGVRAVGTAIGGVGDVLFQVIKEGVKAVSPKTVEAIKGGVAKVGESDLVQNVAAKYSDWATRNPEQAKDLEATLNIASIVPIGKAAQVGSKAVSQVAKQTGTALKSAATKVKPAIGRALSTTGAIGEKTGKSLVSASLSPTMEQAGRIITYKSKTPLLTRLQQASKGIEKAPITPADVAIKYDLASLSRSQIGIKAKRVANDLFENQVKPALNSIKEKVSKQELFNSVKKEINKIKDISTRKAQLNALESLADDYKNVSSWSYKTLDTIKSEMAKRLPSKVWKGQDIAGDLNNVRKILSDKARNVIRKKLPKEITTIYDEYGSLKELSERGAKALTSGLNTNLIGLTGEAMRIATTPITTLGGSAISKAGTAVRKLGNKLLKSKPLPKGKGEILKSTPLKPKTNPVEEVKNFKRDVTLQGQDKIVQEKSIEKFVKNKQKLVNEYIKDNGLVANTDNARKLFSDVGYTGSNSAAVHEASSALNKLVWKKTLKLAKNKEAILFSGGSGSGKSSVAEQFVRGLKKGNSAVLDSNLSGYNSAVASIAETLKAKKVARIVYIYREPVDAFLGTIKRMLTNPKEGGRLVPIKITAGNHPNSLGVAKKIYEEYGDLIAKKKLKFTFINNSNGAGKAVKMDYNKVKNIKLPNDLESQMKKALDKIYKDGVIIKGKKYKITKEQYNQLIK